MKKAQTFLVLLLLGFVVMIPFFAPEEKIALAQLQQGVIISEVFYDHSGSDDRYEWVELYNASKTTSFDLSDFSLGNGGSDYTYSLVQLSGTIGPGECFVVGGPSFDDENGNPTYNQEYDFEPDFQNSGSVADGVALFDVAASQVTASTCPIDAVIYGATNSNNLMDESCAAGAVDVGDASAGKSIERTDNAGTWQIQSTPNPNDCSRLEQTLITLASFTATAHDGYVLVEWETASEIDNDGFNLWRSEAPDGPYTKLNADLIPAQGGPTSGASYSYHDDAVTNGVTYWYKLEDVDLYGVSTFHGPVGALGGRVHRQYLPLILKGG